MSDAATTLKPSEVLEKAADLIEPEGAWTQGVSAETATGCSTFPSSDDATSWCLFGALERFGRADGSVWSLVKAATGQATPIIWNDAPGRTQPEVVAALRKAAELARGAGQ